MGLTKWQTVQQARQSSSDTQQKSNGNNQTQQLQKKLPHTHQTDPPQEPYSGDTFSDNRCQIKEQDFDSANPWTDEGPLLRKDSFTARQLMFLTPEAVHLEGRKLFIGDFPDKWVENNVQKFFQRVRTRTERRYVKTAQLDAIVDPTHDVSNQVRNIDDLAFANNIAGTTDQTIMDQSTKRRKLMKALRTRRKRFRKHKLAPVALKPATSASSTLRSASPAAHSAIKQNDKTIATEPATKLMDTQSQSEQSSTLSDSEFFDCNSSFGSDSTHSRVAHTNQEVAHEEELEDYEDTLPTVDIQTPNESVETLRAENAKYVPSVREERDGSRAEADLLAPPSQARRSKLPGAHRLTRYRPTHMNRMWKKKQHVAKIFQGRFLVQERRSYSMRPVVNEIEAPLATHLTTRWRECAVLAKQTNNPAKPLVLYFYDSVNEKRLVRKSRRKWMRSLLFKITLDSHYETSLFSPIDMTFAIWRPKVPSDKRHLHIHLPGGSNKSSQSKYKNRRKRDNKDNSDQNKGHTRILLIHSQSLKTIMNLAYLLTSAIRGAAWSRDASCMSVNVPSAGINVQVESKISIQDAFEEAHLANMDQRGLVGYQNLLRPIVGESPNLKRLMETVWHVIQRLPRRFQAWEENEIRKYALAWVVPGFEHRPLWLSSAGPNTIPLVWYNWMMKSNASLSLIQPRPTCYELRTSKEPRAVEGFCSKVLINTYKKTQLGIYRLASGCSRRTAQYLFTADNYLLYTTAKHATLPMLASSQNTLEKVVDPFPLDESRENISWIKYSSCLREVDCHDVIAEMEFERRNSLILNARGLINLLFVDSIVANDKDEVEIRGSGGNIFVLRFGCSQVAEVWAERLQLISDHWKQVARARTLRKATKTMVDFGISSYLQNRNIVYSGKVFMKSHLFASFKSFRALLTTKALILFKIEQTKRPPTDPTQSVPSGSYLHRFYMSIDLQDTYTYTGQAAAHVLLNDDTHTDPNNPGVRALPRSYEDGCISQDTELDRCFVIWHNRKRTLPFINKAGDGKFFAFLAQEQHERDKWATAIRHVQTSLAGRRGDPNLADELEEETGDKTLPPEVGDDTTDIGVLDFINENMSDADSEAESELL